MTWRSIITPSLLEVVIKSAKPTTGACLLDGFVTMGKPDKSDLSEDEIKTLKLIRFIGFGKLSLLVSEGKIVRVEAPTYKSFKFDSDKHLNT